MCHFCSSETISDPGNQNFTKWKHTNNRKELIPMQDMTSDEFPCSMALRVRLWNLEPPEHLDEYPEESYEAFENIDFEELYMYILEPDENPEVFDVILFFLNDKNELECLNRLIGTLNSSMFYWREEDMDVVEEILSITEEKVKEFIDRKARVPE